MVGLNSFRLDCKDFKGNLPCIHKTSCKECSYYRPQGKKILIIKLGAVGDVLRTTPILRGLKRKFPQSFISWLTRKESIDLLKDNTYIDRLLAYGLESMQKLEIEEFDMLICLDKEIAATATAVLVKAKKKIGFGLDSKSGNTFPFNNESIYAFNLGLSDELKFKQNKKTYPQIIFEMADLAYKNDEYVLNISNTDKEYAYKLLSKFKDGKNVPIIGLNTGAGWRFVNKAWTEKGFVDLIKLIRKNTKARIFLLGGPQERELNARIISKVGTLAYDVGCYHSLGQFMAIVDTTSLVVSGDTTALHIAIALKKPIVAIFGSTCAQEIELYGRGIKLTANIDCRPCYRRECDKKINCMTLIRPATVLKAIQKLLPK
jgi:heptosyltransferase-2